MEELKKGYKKTKIGVIPEDWEVVKLGEVFKFLKTYSFSRKNLSQEGEIYYIHYGDIHKKYSFHLNLDIETLPKINKKYFKTKIEYLKDGDLIVADASEDYEGIAKSIEIKNIKDKKVVSGLHTFALRDKDNFFMNGYKGYILHHKEVKKRVKQIATGISVLGISKSEFSKILIPLPPLKEQEKIAKILSTWDKAIDLQEELIKEKEKLKTALMQKLLSGKVRFKDFNKEWEDVRLRETGNIVTGSTPSTKKEEYYKNGIYPWVTPTDITEKKYICTSNKYLTKEGIKKGRLIKKNALLVTCIASIGKNAILCSDGSCNQQINAIEVNNEFDVEFLYYLLEYKKKYLMEFAGQGGMMILNKNDFSNLKFKLPPLKEQQKIAKVLSTADREIELLKEELKELKNQKKALIQKLLTGKVRVKV